MTTHTQPDNRKPRQKSAAKKELTSIVTCFLWRKRDLAFCLDMLTHITQHDGVGIGQLICVLPGDGGSECCYNWGCWLIPPKTHINSKKAITTTTKTIGISPTLWKWLLTSGWVMRFIHNNSRPTNQPPPVSSTVIVVTFKQITTRLINKTNTNNDNNNNNNGTLTHKQQQQKRRDAVYCWLIKTNNRSNNKVKYSRVFCCCC